MASKEDEVVVKVPHRISGFFEIVDELDGIKIINPTKIGSRGAGFNLDMFGTTKIKRLSNDLRNKIFINGIKLDERAETTYYILNYLKNIIKKPFSVELHHNFDLPVGCGYGASGSGALGTIFAIDRLLNLKISGTEKVKIAHIAEVSSKTGLGTVCGQIGRGLCILKEPGIPCLSERIEFPNDLRIVCGTFGVIHTKSILSDPSISQKIKKEGQIALLNLLKDPDIKNFIKNSKKFVKNTEIINTLNLFQVKQLLDDLSKINILGASMNQLGRSVYAICYKKQLKDVKQIFETYKPKIKIFISSIYKDKTIIFR